MIRCDGYDVESGHGFFCWMFPMAWHAWYAGTASGVARLFCFVLFLVQGKEYQESFALILVRYETMRDEELIEWIIIVTTVGWCRGIEDIASTAAFRALP